MTRLMSKLLILTILSSSLVFAKTDVKKVQESQEDKTKKELVNYVKRAVSVNKDFKLKDVRIKQSKNVDNMDGWKLYFLDIDLEIISRNGKVTTVHDKIFSNGKYLTRDFVELSNKKSLKDRIVPDMDNSYYKKDHLVYGDFNAKDKIVVFSDPICPFCQNYMPEIFKAVKANPKKIALFYYHFPLEMIHPEAPTIIKAAMAAEKNGMKDALVKVYNKKFNIESKDEQKILDIFNEKMGTKLTLKDINTQEILKHYSQDLELAGKMMIGGTPTVYVNGKKDFSRTKYKQILGIK